MNARETNSRDRKGLSSTERVQGCMTQSHSWRNVWVLCAASHWSQSIAMQRAYTQTWRLVADSRTKRVIEREEKWTLKSSSHGLLAFHMHASTIHTDVRAFLSWSCMQYKYTYENGWGRVSETAHKARASCEFTRVCSPFGARVNSRSVHTDVLGFLERASKCPARESWGETGASKTADRDTLWDMVFPFDESRIIINHFGYYKFNQMNIAEWNLDYEKRFSEGNYLPTTRLSETGCEFQQLNRQIQESDVTEVVPTNE